MPTPTLREAAQALSDETGDAKRGGVYHVDYRDMAKLRAALSAEDEREAAIAGLVEAITALVFHLDGGQTYIQSTWDDEKDLRAALEAARKAGLTR